jgi:bifunctional UDP-N-acetylglucosamine pyrophosphorylase/glucosamine-1-phosphate N-acetyltransferase
MTDFAKIPAVVLAAGQGKRMNSDLPKVIHPILGTPMVGLVVRNLQAAGIDRVLAIVGHGKEQVIKALDKGCTPIDQGKPRGTGHAVLAARDELKGYTGPLLVLNGDVPLIRPDTIRSLVQSLDEAQAQAVLMTCRVIDPTGYGRIVRNDEGKVMRIVEHRDATDELSLNEINVGVYCFKAPEIFDTLEKVEPSASNGEIYLTDAARLILEAGGGVEGIHVADPTEAAGINSRKDLAAVTNFLRGQVLAAHMENGVTIVDPATVYIEEGVTIGRDTILYPFVMLQKGVRIGKRCRIGPFARLRGQADLADETEIGNFVEVKSSRIGAGSKAKHLAYLGDAVLGEGVNIGAGTITANYDGRSKHTTTIEDRASTGCNTVFVAPVRMGAGSKTGAGTIIPRGQDVAPDDVVVGIPARSIKKKVKQK